MFYHRAMQGDAAGTGARLGSSFKSSKLQERNASNEEGSGSGLRMASAAVLCHTTQKFRRCPQIVSAVEIQCDR
jgi:hypothetical protein